MTDLASSELILSRLARREPARTEADIQADVYSLLVNGYLNIDAGEAHMESPSDDGTRRRIDVEVGQVAIEVKKNLGRGNVLQEAEQQLGGYVLSKKRTTGAHYSGILTDGQVWRLYELTANGVTEFVDEMILDASNSNRLYAWLEAILSTQSLVLPVPSEIVGRLGSESPAHKADYAALLDLFENNANNTEIQHSREVSGRNFSAQLLGAHSKTTRTFS